MPWSPTRWAAAVFDTRLKGLEFVWGSAAKAAAHMLERAGFRLVVPPESFLVKGMKAPHLEAGELERAREWARALGAAVSASQLQPVAS
jgi:hypothetical protein